MVDRNAIEQLSIALDAASLLSYQAAPSGTNSGTNPYATIDGKRYEAHVHEIASWHTIIGGGAGQMEAKYENRLCELTLMTGDEQFTTGVAYNERYLGTLW